VLGSFMSMKSITISPPKSRSRKLAGDFLGASRLVWNAVCSTILVVDFPEFDVDGHSASGGGDHDGAADLSRTRFSKIDAICSSTWNLEKSGLSAS